MSTNSVKTKSGNNNERSMKSNKTIRRNSEPAQKEEGCCAKFLACCCCVKKNKEEVDMHETITPDANDRLHREKGPDNFHSKLYHDTYDSGPQKFKPKDAKLLEAINNPFYMGVGLGEVHIPPN